ncbi:hypothetical protein GCM10027565_19510 [Bordetella tumulicola]
MGGADLIKTARPNQGPRPRYAGLPVFQKAGAPHWQTTGTHSRDNAMVVGPRRAVMNIYRIDVRRAENTRECET